MVNSNPSSPPHFGLAGTFSAVDIQELLGAMAGEHQRSASSSEAGADEERSTFVNRPCSENNDIDDDTKAQARTERKRSREKQRRSDVNRQFADLTKLLKDIEAEEAEEDHTVARLAFSTTNRVDMIARTITHLERLRAINKRRKSEVESLKEELEQSKKAGEDTAAKLKEAMFNQPTPQSKQQVMMMVPMMIPSDGSSPYAGGGAASASMSMMNPFMMPQPYGLMPQQMHTPAAAAAPPGQHNMHQQQQQHHHQPQMPSFQGFTMAPNQHQHQQQALPQPPAPTAHQATPNPAPAPANHQTNPTPSQASGGSLGQSVASNNNHCTQHSQPFSQSYPSQVPILPTNGIGGFSIGSGNTQPIAPNNPMSFFMSQHQPFLSQATAAAAAAAAAQSQMAPASTAGGPTRNTSTAAPPGDHGAAPTTMTTDNVNDHSSHSPASNTSSSGDSKSPPPGQEGGLQGGSNLAHCA